MQCCFHAVLQTRNKLPDISGGRVQREFWYVGQDIIDFGVSPGKQATSHRFKSSKTLYLRNTSLKTMQLGNPKNQRNHRFTFTTGAATQEIELWFYVQSPILNASHNGSNLVYDIEPFDIKINNISIAEITDYQGFTADVQTSTMYYPFGMQMPGRVYNGDDYRYGFQGQEKDDEIKGSGNSINYKFRVQDSRLGRFLSIDPLTPDYPHNSPYAFSENRVIDAVELEGLEKVTYIWKWNEETSGYEKPIKLEQAYGTGVAYVWHGGPNVPDGYNKRMVVVDRENNIHVDLAIGKNRLEKMIESIEGMLKKVHFFADGEDDRNNTGKKTDDKDVEEFDLSAVLHVFKVISRNPTKKPGLKSVSTEKKKARTFVELSKTQKQEKNDENKADSVTVLISVAKQKGKGSDGKARVVHSVSDTTVRAEDSAEVVSKTHNR